MSVAYDVEEFRESDHPRDSDGKFGSVGKGAPEAQLSLHSRRKRAIGLHKVVDSMEGVSTSTRDKIRAAVRVGAECFSKPDLSKEEQRLVYNWKTDSNLLSKSEFNKIVVRGKVIKDVTVYRAGSNSDDKVLEYSLRKDWVNNLAESLDRPVVSLNLKVGDSALFVPYATTHHLVEVGVLVPAKAPEHADDAGEFREEDHPRESDGKFGSGGGSNSATVESLLQQKKDLVKEYNELYGNKFNWHKKDGN